MDETTTKLVKEKFDALPQSIQEVILSSHYEESLIEIGKQYSLNVEQLGILERETTLTMMGLTPTKDFESELARELNIDRIKVSQIVKDINEKIFLKIRELLKLMNTPIGEEPSVEEEVDEIMGGNTNKDIMKRAGIEIMPDQISASSAPTINIFNTPKREETLKAIEKPEPIIKNEIHPMFEQKMSKPFQIPMVKTEHSLDNLSKTQTLIEQTPRGNIIPVRKITDIKTPVPQAKDYSKTGDPYRLNPNE